MQPSINKKIIYAEFWRRFCALLIDAVALLPLFAVSFWLSDKHRLFNFYYFLPHLIFLIWYNVYLVKKFGGTPGKILLGLKITNLDGTAVDRKTAFKRYSVQLILTTLNLIAILFATLKLTDAEYNSLSYFDRSAVLLKHMPDWAKFVSRASDFWGSGELIVVLLNEKRRSLHDLIAGTVVVQKSEAKSFEPGHTLQARIAICTIAILFGLAISYSQSEHKRIRKDGEQYNDYKILLNDFETNFENIGEVPWYVIQKDCTKYHQKRHESKFIIDKFSNSSLYFIDSSLITNKIYIDPLEEYTKIAYESLSPTLDDTYAPAILLRQIKKFDHEDEIKTIWKNISIGSRCYHLLEEVGPSPKTIKIHQEREQIKIEHEKWLKRMKQIEEVDRGIP